MPSTLEPALTWLRLRLGLDADRGASMVEYALLVALIAVACLVSIKALGHSASSSFSRTGAQFDSTGG